MGTRALHARLTERVLALAVAVLLAAGGTALAVCDHVLDRNDTAAARSNAANARDAFARELAEGDEPARAAEEVLSGAAAAGIGLVLENETHEKFGSADFVSALPAGACATFTDRAENPWRACATESGPLTAIAAIPIASERAAIRSITEAMACIFVIAIIAFWLGVRSAIGTPTKELTNLVDWTSEIVETEAVAVPPNTTTTEIAQLRSAFDILVRRILEALSRERATSAHIAHELRTPLTSIVAELDAITGADEETRRALERVRLDVTRLADVIDAILVLSVKPRSSGGLLVNVADLARDLAPAAVVVDAPDEALIEGDERLVALALRNLLENAAKYGGGAERIRVSHDEGRVRLSVIDGGPGLDEASRARMFDRYWRGAADGAGRGLGLALVRAVAERHGGIAEATARLERSGLVVSFVLDPCVGWQEHENAR